MQPNETGSSGGFGRSCQKAGLDYRHVDAGRRDHRPARHPGGRLSTLLIDDLRRALRVVTKPKTPPRPEHPRSQASRSEESPLLTSHQRRASRKSPCVRKQKPHRRYRAVDGDPDRLAVFLCRPRGRTHRRRAAAAIRQSTRTHPTRPLPRARPAAPRSGARERSRSPAAAVSRNP